MIQCQTFTSHATHLLQLVMLYRSITCMQTLVIVKLSTVNTSSNTTQYMVEKWLVYNREEDTRIEGGDELVLSKDVLAVGISQRTDAASIEKLLVNIFKKNVGFKKVLAFEFANNRKFMHLDTVFTMVDYDKFTIHPEIEGDLRVYSVTYVDDKLKIVEEKGDLAESWQKTLVWKKFT